MTATSEPAAESLRTPAVVWTARAQWLLLAITGLAVVARLFRLELWSLDAAEAATWRAITMPLSGADGFFASDLSAAPLVPLALRVLVDHVLLGTGEGWLRLPFGFLGALSVPLLALFGARLVGVPAALGSACLLAIHPLHVAASQTASGPVVAIAFALLAGCLAHRSRLAAGVGLLLALGSWRGAWPLLAPAVVLLIWSRVPRTWHHRVLTTLMVLLVAAAWCGVGSLGAPIILFAALGGLLGSAVTTLLAALPTVALVADNLRRGAAPGQDSVLVLPVILLLASVALLRCTQALREHLPGTWLLRTVAAKLPAALVGVALLVDLFLYATVWHGLRTAWRDAARLAVGGLEGHSGLSVAAVAGAEPLRYYLRPAHYAGLPSDPHPGIEVLPLPALDPVAALDTALSVAAERSVWLVLRGDEQRAFVARAEVAERLPREFVLHRVVQGARPGGDDSLLLYRRRALH